MVDDASGTAPPDDLTPGFKPDPRGEARRRYWDGTTWTSLLSDQGQHRAPQVRGAVIPLVARWSVHSTERLVVEDARIVLHVDAFLEPLVVDRAAVRGGVIASRRKTPATLAWSPDGRETQRTKQVKQASSRLNLPNVMSTGHDRVNLTVVFRAPQRWPQISASTRLNHPRATRRQLDGVGVRVADLDAASAALEHMGIVVCSTVNDLLRRA